MKLVWFIAFIFCSNSVVIFQESQIVPAFMLTIDSEQMPALFQYYKSSIRPSSGASSVPLDFESDEKENVDKPLNMSSADRLTNLSKHASVMEESDFPMRLFARNQPFHFRDEDPRIELLSLLDEQPQGSRDSI
jgi:hypothetical protein